MKREIAQYVSECDTCQRRRQASEAEILEVLAVNLLAVVNCEFGRYSEAANNVLPEEFLCSL
jgi:hypothetical protein